MTGGELKLIDRIADLEDALLDCKYLMEKMDEVFARIADLDEPDRLAIVDMNEEAKAQIKDITGRRP